MATTPNQIGFRVRVHSCVYDGCELSPARGDIRLTTIRVHIRTCVYFNQIRSNTINSDCLRSADGANEAYFMSLGSCFLSQHMKSGRLGLVESDSGKATVVHAEGVVRKYQSLTRNLLQFQNVMNPVE